MFPQFWDPWRDVKPKSGTLNQSSLPSTKWIKHLLYHFWARLHSRRQMAGSTWILFGTWGYWNTIDYTSFVNTLLNSNRIDRIQFRKSTPRPVPHKHELGPRTDNAPIVLTSKMNIDIPKDDKDGNLPHTERLVKSSLHTMNQCTMQCYINHS